MTYGPPEYPPATGSPTIILLVSGMTALLGFLIGFSFGLGSGGAPGAAPAPTVTVTVEDEPPTGGPETAQQPTAATTPGGPTPGTTASPGATADPWTTDPGATGSGAANPGGTTPGAATPGAGGTDPLGALASLRTLVVGVDIEPGTYRTTGPAAGATQCYWARTRSATGGIDDVIDAGMPTGPASVTILATDKGFQTAGCAEWTKV